MARRRYKPPPREPFSFWRVLSNGIALLFKVSFMAFRASLLIILAIIIFGVLNDHIKNPPGQG